MQKNQNLAYRYALGAVFFWSTVATAFKLSLEHLQPAELLFYSSFASFVLLFFMLLKQKKLSMVIPYISQNFTLVLTLGAINPFIYYLVLFKAYDLLPAQEAQAINYTWALMLAYLGAVFLKQKLSKADIIAGFICYFGVLIIATKGDPFSLSFSNAFGVFLALLSTILWALYWIFNSRSKADPVVGLFCNFAVGLVFIAVYMYVIVGFSTPSWQGLLGAFYVGLFEMGIAFVFWLKAVNLSTNVSKISNLIFLSPFVSLVFIAIFVGEEILLSTLVALGFIIGGLVLQQKLKV